MASFFPKKKVWAQLFALEKFAMFMEKENPCSFFRLSFRATLTFYNSYRIARNFKDTTLKVVVLLSK